MRLRLGITIILIIGTTGTAAAGTTGMFCHPGENWHQIAGGTIGQAGWSVANITKPEGGAMRITWTLVDFDDGPATAGIIYGQEPEVIDGQAFFYTDEHEQHAQLRADTNGFEIDRKVSAGRLGSIGDPTTVASLTLGPTVQDDDLHILQYAAGEDHDGHEVRWEVLLDDCASDPSPPVHVSQDDEATFLTPDDLHGTLNAQLRVHAPGVPTNGAVALMEASATAQASDVPYVNTWWSNDAGNVQLDGPDDLTMDDISCFDFGDKTLCRGWGQHAISTLVPGPYQFSVTGFTDPLQNPTGSTQGPYITLLSTQLPGGEPE